MTKGRAWWETYEVNPWHAFHVHNPHPVYWLANHSRNSERYLFEILPQLIRLIRILLKKLSFFGLFVPDTSLQFIMTSSLMGVIIFFLPLFANRLFISFLSYFFSFFFFFFFFFFSPSLFRSLLRVTGHAMSDEKTWLFLWGPKEGEGWLQSRSVLGFFGVVLMSCRVNFHVVRSALQYSACRI